MKLYFLFVLIIISCNSKNSIKEEFYCSEDVESKRSFFKKMKNIKYFKNNRTGEIENRKIEFFDEIKYDTLIKANYVDVIFNIPNYNSRRDIYQAFFINGTLFFKYKYAFFPLFNLDKPEINRYSHYKRDLKEKYYDSSCNDTIYAFEYLFYPETTHMPMDSTGLREVWASRKRGILKIVYQDSIGDLWTGKFYPERSRSTKSPDFEATE